MNRRRTNAAFASVSAIDIPGLVYNAAQDRSKIAAKGMTVIASSMQLRD